MKIMAERAFRYRIAAISLVAAFAAAPGATTVQAQSFGMRAKIMAAAQACRADIGQYCANVQRGGGRILSCLQSHSSELTPSCRDAMPKAEALKSQAIGAGVPQR
jgi:Cysteine rich repeat